MTPTRTKLSTIEMIMGTRRVQRMKAVATERYDRHFGRQEPLKDYQDRFIEKKYNELECPTRRMHGVMQER